MYHIEQADVVIVGAGPAGAMAAIYVHRNDPDLRVVVLDKSKIETSGAAGRGMDALNTIAVPPASQPEDVVDHLTRVTEGVLDQEVAYAYGKTGLQVINDLETMMNRSKGDVFPVDENGNYQLYYLHPIDKALMIPMHAEEMKRAMGKASGALDDLERARCARPARGFMIEHLLLKLSPKTDALPACWRSICEPGNIFISKPKSCV